MYDFVELKVQRNWFALHKGNETVDHFVTSMAHNPNYLRKYSKYERQYATSKIRAQK